MHWFTNSKLFELARRGQRLTHIAAVIPLAFVIPLVSQFAAIPVVIAMFIRFGFSESILTMEGVPALEAGFWMSMQLISSFAMIYVILWLWLKFFEKRPFWTMGYELKNALMQYGRGFLFGTIMFAGAVGILALFKSV